MDKIWIVSASKGEYDDFTEWTVCACLTEKRAMEVINQIDELAAKIKQRPSYDYLRGKYHNDKVEEIRKLDPNYEWNCSYDLYECEIR